MSTGRGGTTGGGRGSSRGRRGRGGFRGSLTDDALPSSLPARPVVVAAAPEPVAVKVTPPTAAPQGEDEVGEEEDEDQCWICAEKVTYWALGKCDHRTCHVCSIRLRALYKKHECTFCKTDCPEVIFTTSGTKAWAEYSPRDTPFSDARSGILFETADQKEESLLLLRFNCPCVMDASPSSPAYSRLDEPGADACNIYCRSWDELKNHIRSYHKLALCDVCVANKKVFAHEHEVFSYRSIREHEAAAHKRCGFSGLKAFESCTRPFYDDEALQKHCREKHEECFICSRRGIKHQYHLDYSKLELHFREKHYMCPHPRCMEEKFVVFESEIDLKAHFKDNHQGEGTAVAGSSSSARRELRTVETNFSFQPVPGASRRGYDRDRDAQQASTSAAAAVPPSPAVEETSGGRRRIPGLGPAAEETQHTRGEGSSSRRGKFRGGLTPSSAAGGSSSTTPPNASSAPSSDNEGPSSVQKQRHDALLKRVETAVGGGETKVASFRASVRGFRQSEITSDDLIDTLATILRLDSGANRSELVESIVLDLIGLMDDEDKRSQLRRGLSEFRERQNDFPTLSGMPGSSSGTAARPGMSYARAIPPSIVSMHPGAASSGGARSRAQVTPLWERVERAANTSSATAVRDAFPQLSVTGSRLGVGGRVVPGAQARSKAVSTTAWTSAGGSGGGQRSGNNSGSSTPRPASPAGAPARFVDPQTETDEFPRVISSSSSSARPAAAVAAPSWLAPSSSAARPKPAAARPAVKGAEFPSLPSSSVEADRRARTKALFANSNGAAGASAASSPKAWSPGATSPVDNGALEAGMGGLQVDAPLANGGGGKKKGKGKVLLMSHGTMGRS